MHILGSIEPVNMIWVSLERPFPPAEHEYIDDANFDQR